MGARGSQANQGGGGIPTELRQHKKDYTGDWMGRGGRKYFSSASPRRVGSHTNQGTVKGPIRGARCSPAHQQGTCTQKNQRHHKIDDSDGRRGRETMAKAEAAVVAEYLRHVRVTPAQMLGLELGQEYIAATEDSLAGAMQDKAPVTPKLNPAQPTS